MSFASAGNGGLKTCRMFVLDANDRVRAYMDDALRPIGSVHLFAEDVALLDALKTMRPPDITVVGLNFRQHAESTWRQALKLMGGSPILFLTAAAEAEDVALAIELGATGFLQAPFSKRELQEAAGEQMARARIYANRARDFETPLGDGSSFVRSSQGMQELEAQAALVAKSEIALLILGESGTGKEVLAKYTHLMSARSRKMFLKVNCAAMPAELLESELFGYEKGAFTGAVTQKPGKFEICRGGTIFLDEVGEMPAVLQAKLLHVLQDGTYSRLGAREPMKADVRVIAATNIDMKAAMLAKTFREDLYYRLNGFSLTLPPLRERSEEIPVFARHFMKRAAEKYGREPLAFSNSMLRAMSGYSWPGNLRELENLMNRYLIIGDEASILQELNPEGAPSQFAEAFSDKSTGVGLKALMRSLKGNAESAAIASVLEETKWNRKEAASKMQISYKALLGKIKEYELTPPVN